MVVENYQILNKEAAIVQNVRKEIKSNLFIKQVGFYKVIFL